jgi:hypothetical protein
MAVEDEASPRHGCLASWAASPNINHQITLIRHGRSGSFSVSLPHQAFGNRRWRRHN